MADNNGLKSIHYAGYARVTDTEKRIEFNYVLTRKNSHTPEVNIIHTLELVGDNKSYVQASFTVNGGSVPTNYYYDYAADIKGMHKGMMNYADSIFGSAVKLLTSIK